MVASSGLRFKRNWNLRGMERNGAWGSISLGEASLPVQPPLFDLVSSGGQGTEGESSVNCGDDVGSDEIGPANGGFRRNMIADPSEDGVSTTLPQGEGCEYRP